MDLVYNVTKGRFEKSEWLRDEHYALTISCRNVVAFSFTHQLLPNSKSTPKDKPGIYNLSKHVVQYYIYVCDLDKPWELYKVTSQDARVQCMEWDVSGTRLLIADMHGNCQIWSMKDYLLNEWSLDSTVSVMEEEILSIAWFHTGVLHHFLAEKKDTHYYNEKYVRAQFSPSVCQFGGGAVDGWIAVTATGLACVCHISGDKHTSLTVNNLSPVRSQIVMADIAFADDGAIHITTTDGCVTSALQFYKINLKLSQNVVSMTCKPHASFFCRSAQENSVRESPNAKISHVKFLSVDCVDSVVVVGNNGCASFMELWKLQEHSANIHRMFVTMAVESKYTSMRWMHKSTVTNNSIALAVAMPKFPVMHNLQDPTVNALQYIAVSFKDKTVKLISKNMFHIVNSFSLESTVIQQDSERYSRVIPSMITLTQTFSGCGIIGLDSQGALSLIRPINVRDTTVQISYMYIISMLEYMMLTGYDWWDVMLMLRSGPLDGMIQRLSDHFYKQPQSVQEFLYTRFMALKASLYRLTLGSQQKVADCLSGLLLNSVATAFKAIIRPKSLANQDKSPAEKLLVLCSKSPEFELNQMMMSLETKEFIVGPSTLQSMQQLIQWVADFVLYLLASLPMYQNYGNYPGSSIIRDSSCLVTLREMLLIIRIWGLINPGCLPVFSTSSNVDCLSMMFKLLTRVWLASKDGNMDIDDNLIDDCCILHSQVAVPNVEEIMVLDGRHVSIINSMQPIRFQYNETPDQLTKPVSHSLLLENQGTLLGKRDCVRQIGLGQSPVDKVKQCSRCGNISLLHRLIKSQDLKIWDQRWTRLCLCGGQWKLASGH